MAALTSAPGLALAVGGRARDPEVVTSDVLSHGERRGSSPWWYAGLAATLALATGLGLMAGSADSVKPPPAATRTTAPSPSAGAADLDGPTYSSLLVAGDRLLRLDVDRTSARSLSIPGLGPDRYVSSLASRRGATVVLVSERRGPARPGSAWTVPAGGGTPVPLGLADQVLPAVAPDQVWLVTSPAAGQGGHRLLRRLDMRGRPLSPGYAIDVAGRLVADVDDGFLVERTGAGGSGLDVVDRRTGRLHERLAPRGATLAAGPHQLAWVDRSCHLRCTVQVLDLRSGFRLVVSILDVAAYGGAMASPDGGRLAFTALAVVTPGGSPVPVLLVAGVDDPGISVVRLPAAAPGQAAASSLPRTLTWSANGDWVFLATPTLPQRLLAWRLGSAATAVVRFPMAGVSVVAAA